MVSNKIKNMKQLIPLFLFLFLLPCLALAQYPSNGNQKITLGEQTSADGLIYRGVALTDTVRKPSIDTMAYMVLDTTTNIIWHYKKATSNAWLRVGGSISSGLTGTLPEANGGTGITSLGTGVATFLGTPSSANLASAVTNETGSGNLVFATQPVFTNTVGIGGATASTSGSGITFPATQSASTDANTLDDYEEGTWTPDLREETTSRSPTYAFNSGRYVKFGKLVYIEFGFALSNKGSGSGSGQVKIYGLPYTSLSYGAYQEPNARYFGGGFTTASTTNDVLQVQGGVNNLRGWKTDNANANVGANPIPYTEITNSSFIMLQMYYIAN
jgi:hypothetical protein